MLRTKSWFRNQKTHQLLIQSSSTLSVQVQSDGRGESSTVLYGSLKCGDDGGGSIDERGKLHPTAQFMQVPNGGWSEGIYRFLRHNGVLTVLSVPLYFYRQQTSK